MIKIDNQIRFLGFILVLFLITFQSSFAADAGTNYNEAKEYVEDVKTINPNLPEVENQKWVVWNLLSRLFDSNGQIWNLFIKALWTRWDTAVLRWSGWTTGQLVSGSIFDTWTNVSIWGTPLSNRKLSVYGDINFSWNLYRDGVLVDFAGKFVDGTNINNAVYTWWNVGIGKQPTQALDVSGNIASSGYASIDYLKFNNNEPGNLNSDGDVWFDSSRGIIINRSQQVWQENWNGTYTVLDTSNISWLNGVTISNTAAWISWIESINFWLSNVSWSVLADSSITSSKIQNGSITSANIANNTITESDISDSFVARDSSLLDWLDSTIFARKDTTNTFLEALTISNANYNAHLNLIRSGETWNITPSTDGSLNFLHPSGWSDNRLEVPGLDSSARITVWGTNVFLYWDSWDNIQDDTIDSSEIQNGTITSTDIANNTITEADISDSFVARDSNLLDGYDSSENSVWSTIAVRNSSWDINARLFRSEYDSTNGNIGYIMTQVDTDNNNFIRPSTPAQFRSAITDGFYVGKTGNETISWNKTFSDTITATNWVGFSWEAGVNSITHNDWWWNVQIRFWHDFTSSDERFIHDGTAFYIWWGLDSSNGQLEMKVATNGWAWNDQAITWWPTFSIWQSDITWWWASILTSSSSINGSQITDNTIDSSELNNSAVFTVWGIRTYHDNNEPWTDTQFWRSSSQYMTLHGWSGWNYLSSISSDTNQKNFAIKVYRWATMNQFIFDGSNGMFTAASISWNGASITNISWDNIQDGTIDGSEIQNGTITSTDIANDTITETDISNGFVARNSNLLDWYNTSTSGAANSVVVSNGSADIFARLFRSSYAWQTSVSQSADIAFRNNDSNDNYIRFTNRTGLLGYIGKVNDSDTLDGIDSWSFLRSDANEYYTGWKLIVQRDSTNTINTSWDTSQFQIRQSNSSGDSYATFHIAWKYAANFGLDGTTNDFAVWGWSLGTNSYRVLHEWNLWSVTIPGDSIQNGTIDSSEIQDNTITGADIAANSINGSELNSNAVTSWHIVNGTITGTDIATNTITESDIADNFVARNSSQLWGRILAEWSAASTVVSRDGAGDINARLFRSEYDSTNGNVWYIMTQVDTASNNYIRPTTKAQFRAAVTDGAYINIWSSWDQIQDNTIDSSEIQNGTIWRIDLATDARTRCTTVRWSEWMELPSWLRPGSGRYMIHVGSVSQRCQELWYDFWTPRTSFINWCQYSNWSMAAWAENATWSAPVKAWRSIPCDYRMAVAEAVCCHQ